MPHGSVCSSMIFCRSSLSRSRSASSWSRSAPPSDGAQRGLGDLGGGRRERLDRRHRRRRVDDAEVADGGDPRRDVVAGDELLRRDRHRDRPQVDAHHPVHAAAAGRRARALDRQQPAEAEHDGALVLAQDAHAERRQRHERRRRRRRRWRWSRGVPFVRFCEAQRLRSAAARLGGHARARARAWGPGSSRDARASRAAASARRPGGSDATSRRARATSAARGCGPADDQHEHRERDEHQRRGRGGSGRPRSAATGPAGGRSRARGRSPCSPPCAGSRCRCGPWRGSGPAAARGRTRAATGAGPRGRPSGRARSSKVKPGGAVAQRPPVGVGRQPLEERRAATSRNARSRRTAGPRRSRQPRRGRLVLSAGGDARRDAASSVKRMSSGSSSVTRLTV